MGVATRLKNVIVGAYLTTRKGELALVKGEARGYLPWDEK
jgi:hypothetical protein